MTLATKRINNMPPYLSYVSILPDITHKQTFDTGELKQRLADTWEVWTVFLRASSTKPVANTAACMCKGKGTSLQTPTVICDQLIK